MQIETKRLMLRPMQAEDIPALVAMWMNADATRYMGGSRERDFLEKTFAEDLTAPALDYDLWPVFEQESSAFVGHCGLLDKEVDSVTEIELTYVIAPESWGRGYATEIAQALAAYAAESLGLSRLIALIDPANTASAAVAQKVGMTHERDVVRPGGKQMQLYAMALPVTS